MSNSNVCSYHLTKGNYFLSFTFQYVTVMKLEHILISFWYCPGIYPDLICSYDLHLLFRCVNFDRYVIS